MKVVLPDQTELELPAAATGLDAARAIGSRSGRRARSVAGTPRHRSPVMPRRARR